MRIVPPTPEGNQPLQETQDQTTLRNLETQIANQRVHIQELQTIHDKAWFGKTKKLRAVELAKKRRDILLKERRDLRERLGLIAKTSTSTEQAESAIA